MLHRCYKYKPYTFDRGQTVTLELKPKPTRINFDNQTQLDNFDTIPGQISIASTPNSTYINEHNLPYDYVSISSRGAKLTPKKTSSPTAQPPVYFAEIDRDNGANNKLTASIRWLDNQVYEGGAIEQAQIFLTQLATTTLSVETKTMVGNALVYIPKFMYASGRAAVFQNNEGSTCPGDSFLLNGGAGMPNNQAFGIYFYGIKVDASDFLQKGYELDIGLTHPTNSYSRIGRPYHDWDSGDFIIRNIETFVGYSLSSDFYNPDSQNPIWTPMSIFTTIFPDTDEKYANHGDITMVVKSRGFIVNDTADTDQDNFTMNLLDITNFVSDSFSSNKFKNTLTKDHSGDAEVTSHFVEVNIEEESGRPSWIKHEIFDTTPGDFVVGQTLQDSVYAQMTLLDNTCENYQPPNSTNMINYAVYIQKVGENTTTANVEINTKIGETLPALEFRVHTISLQVVDFVPVITETDSFTPWYSAYLQYPPIIGHYNPVPYYYSWDTDTVTQNKISVLKNKLHVYVEGVSIFDTALGGATEGLAPVAFVKPTFFQYKPSVQDVFIDYDTVQNKSILHFKQNIETDVDLKNISEFFNTYLDVNFQPIVKTEETVVLGDNRFLISKILWNGVSYSVYLNVKTGDGDLNNTTSQDLYVISYSVQTAINFPSSSYSLNTLTKYQIGQFAGVGSSGRAVSVQSAGNTTSLIFDEPQKSWGTKNVSFVTPSYYQFLFGKKYDATSNPDFILASPGQTVAITDSGYNSVSPQVKGVKFTKTGGVDVVEMNQTDEYDYRFFDYISMGSVNDNIINNFRALIVSYDENFNQIDSYQSPNFSSYHEVNNDATGVTSLDDYISSQHSVLPNIKLISTLSEATNPGNIGKRNIIAKDGGAIVIMIGDQTNIYRCRFTKQAEIPFEAITGITPRVGASAFSCSEGIVIRDGSGSVFAHNRQFIHSQMDMSVSGRATGLSFVRTYRSGVDTVSGLGIGWDHNFNKYFMTDKEGNLNWYQGNGRHDIIDINDMPPGFYCKVAKVGTTTENEHYIVSYQGGSFEEYRQVDSRFKLTKTVDRNGNTVIINWDGISFKAECDNGQFLSFKVNPQTIDLRTLTDGLRTVTYSMSGLLLSSVSFTNANKSFSFNYNNNGMLTTINSNENTSILTNTYNTAVGKEYQVSTQTANGITHAFADLTGGGVSETVSATGVADLITEYHMQSSDMLIQRSRYPDFIIYPGQSVNEKVIYSVPTEIELDLYQIGAVTSRKGIKTKTFYRDEIPNDVFSKGLIERVEVEKAPGSTSLHATISSSFEYTTKTVHQNTNFPITLYLVSKSTDARLNDSNFIYDLKGNLITKSVESDDGLITNRFKYDTFGRLQGTVGPNGSASANLYYDYKDITLTLQATGWLRRSISDGKKRTLAIIDPSLTGSALEAAETSATVDSNAIIDTLLAKDKDNIRDDKTIQVVDFAYDKIGNTTTVVDTLGKSTITEYDSLRRVKKTTGPDFNGHGSTTVAFLYAGKAENGTDKGWGKWTSCISEIPYPTYANSQEDSVNWGKMKSKVTKEYNDNGWLLKEKTKDEATSIVQESANELDGFGRAIVSIVKGKTVAEDQYTTFLYDGRGNLTKTTEADNDKVPTNLPPAGNKTAIVFGFEYDASDNVEVTYKNGKKVSNTIRDGLDRAVGVNNFITNTASRVILDEGSNVTNVKSGMLTETVIGTMGTPFSDVSMVVDKLGVSTQTTDNLFLNEKGIIEPAIYAMSYDIRNNEVKQYNPNYLSNGNFTASSGMMAKSSKRLKSNAAFNESATVISTTDNLISTTTYADGTIITKESNVDGTLKHVTKDESNVKTPEGEITKRRTRFEYDDSGFLLKDVVQEYTGKDKEPFADPTQKDINGNVKITQNTYVRDGVGRAILITDANGHKTHNDFNSLGQVVTVTTGFQSPSAKTKSMTYYENGQLKSEAQGDQKTTYFYDTRSVVTKITYEQNYNDSNLNNITGKKEEEEFEYNDKGLLKIKTLRHNITDAENTQVKITYMYEYEMDANETGLDETDFLAQIKHGNKVLREFGDYTTLEVSFYVNSQPTFAVEHNRFYKSGAIDHSGDVVSYFTYNSSWEVIREISGIRDLRGNDQFKEIKRHFDKAGNLKTLEYPTPSKNSLIYSYDKMNRLYDISNAETSIKSFTYYGLGKVGSSSEGSGKIVQRYSYDRQDWLQSIKSENGVFDAGTFNFKRENNGIKASVDFKVNGGAIKKDIYKYDENDRLISSQYANKAIGDEIFHLDVLDNIINKDAQNKSVINGVAVNNVIKEAVRVDSIDNVNFEYDTRGNTTKDDKYNYSWDDFDRIKTIENKNLDIEPFAVPVGFQSYAIESTTENSITFEFAADNLPALKVDTLVIKKISNNELVVEYKNTHSDLDWSVLPANKVIKTLPDQTIISFGDTFVRQFRIREQNEGNGFELDVTNFPDTNNDNFKFKDYVFPGDLWSKIEYLYDASGRRVQKIVDDTKGYWYLFDGYQMLEERTFTRGNLAGPVLRRQVVYGTAINEPVYIYDATATQNNTNGETYYLLKNDQNTVLALYKASDGAGLPREQYEYSGYGITNILDENGGVKSVDHDANSATPAIKQIKSDYSNPFGYQGMWRDEHTGLYHTHYRLYDPQHVRWLTPDPAGYRDGQNLYRFYAGPNGVDVLGLNDKDAHDKGISDVVNKYFEKYTSKEDRALWFLFMAEKGDIQIVERGLFESDSLDIGKDVGIDSGKVFNDVDEAAFELHKRLSGRYNTILSKFVKPESFAGQVFKSVHDMQVAAGKNEELAYAEYMNKIAVGMHTASQMQTHLENHAINSAITLSTGPALKYLEAGAEASQIALQMLKISRKEKLIVKEVKAVESASTKIIPLGVCFIAGTKIRVQDGYKNIEDIKVGDRVKSTGVSNSKTEVNRSSWKHLTLKMPNPSCDTDILTIDILRPDEWLQNNNCKVGMNVYFVLAEMGIEGFAKVENIKPVLHLEEGEGRVVLSTVTHLNGFIYNIKFKDSTVELNPTDRHLLFNVEKNEFVRTSELQEGDKLKTYSGFVEISNIEKLKGIHQVFNFEVEFEHKYYVSNLDILSHNNDANPCMVTKKLWEVNRYDKVVESGKFGKIFRDPDTGLWWSKDTARHGGHGVESPSAWKVFTEKKTGLEWFSNADDFGNYIIDQHKSPTGSFIPWKEVKGK